MHAATPGPGGTLSVERSAATVAAYTPDFIAWQELEFLHDNSLAPLSADLVESQGLDYFVGLPTSPSHFEGGHRLGIGISSRYAIMGIDYLHFTNPSLYVDWPDRRMCSHDKGMIWATIESPQCKVTFAAVHYIPFHMFGKGADDPTCSRMWEETIKAIRAWKGPALVGGDFNTNNRDLVLKHLPGWGSVALNMNSRPGHGRAFDDFLVSPLLRSMEVVMIPNFSDHYAVLTRFVTG